MNLKYLLFPRKCVACGRIVKDCEACFCTTCKAKVKYIKEPVCQSCGKEIKDAAQEYCENCKKREERFITKNTALLAYEGPVKESLYAFKYRKQKWIGKAYAKQLAARRFDWLSANSFDAVIPVPVSKERLRTRGYNQAEILAANLVNEYEKMTGENKLKILPAVKRVKNTEPQKKLNALTRRKNLKKAFKLDKSVVELERMHKVLVVDDIYTTGATLEAIGELLRRGNIAREVYSMTIAIGRDIY